MTAPNILSFSAVGRGGYLTVPAGTDLIIGLCYYNPTVNLGGVPMVEVINYSNVCSIKKYTNPPSGSLYCDQGIVYFFCLREGVDVGASHAGANASGRDLFSLAGIGGDLVLAIQRTTTTNHTILVDGAAAIIDVDLTTQPIFGQVGHKESTSNPISMDIRDSGIDGEVMGDCAVTIPYYSPDGGSDWM